jgi:hypothetical protein
MNKRLGRLNPFPKEAIINRIRLDGQVRKAVDLLEHVVAV